MDFCVNYNHFAAMVFAKVQSAFFVLKQRKV